MRIMQPGIAGLALFLGGIHVSNVSWSAPLQVDNAASTTRESVCSQTLVRRYATPSDAVCVTSEAAARIARQNEHAAANTQPNSIACFSGFVWRLATPYDKTCVTQQERDDAQLENFRRAAPQIRTFTASAASLAAKLDVSKLPKERGCHKLIGDVWKEADCVNYQFLRAHKLALPAPNNNTIRSEPDWRQIGPSNWVRYTAPMFWGSIQMSFLSDPTAATEIDSGKKFKDVFSMQLNTNNFPCTSCTAGVPFPADSTNRNVASQAGDQGWVQFVYSQDHDPQNGYQGYLCVWNIDLTVAQNTKENGYNAVCVQIPVQHALTGSGAVKSAAEVIGYESCAGPNSACTLSAIAYLP